MKNAPQSPASEPANPLTAARQNIESALEKLYAIPDPRPTPIDQAINWLNAARMAINLPMDIPPAAPAA